MLEAILPATGNKVIQDQTCSQTLCGNRSFLSHDSRLLRNLPGRFFLFSNHSCPKCIMTWKLFLIVSPLSLLLSLFCSEAPLPPARVWKVIKETDPRWANTRGDLMTQHSLMNIGQTKSTSYEFVSFQKYRKQSQKVAKPELTVSYCETWSQQIYLKGRPHDVCHYCWFLFSQGAAADQHVTFIWPVHTVRLWAGSEERNMEVLQQTSLWGSVS